jgi:uncharacterized membrane protein YfcA
MLLAAAVGRRAASSRPVRVNRILAPLSSSFSSQARSFQLGFVSSVVQGSTGVGGSIMLISGLTRHLSFTQIQATGTSMVCQIPTGIPLIATFWSNGFVEPTAALTIATCAVVGARVGAAASSRVNDTHMKLLFGGVLLMLFPVVLHSAVREYRAAATGEVATSSEAPAADTSEVAMASEAEGAVEEVAKGPLQPAGLLGLALAAGATGCLVGAVGVGGTPLMISYLSLATDMTHKEVRHNCASACAPCRPVPPQQCRARLSLTAGPRPPPPWRVTVTADHRHCGLRDLPDLLRRGVDPLQAGQRGHRRRCVGAVGVLHDGVLLPVFHVRKISPDRRARVPVARSAVVVCSDVGGGVGRLFICSDAA